MKPDLVSWCLREREGMTHAELVEIAERWLRRRCGVVVTEYDCACGEVPDAIGFSNKLSVLIECKANRTDFVADMDKRHRHGRGMGQYRYYLVPEGMLMKHEVPEGWGLLYARHGRVRTIKAAQKRAVGRENDYPLLYSLLRRLELRGLLLEAKKPPAGGY